MSLWLEGGQGRIRSGANRWTPSGLGISQDMLPLLGQPRRFPPQLSHRLVYWTLQAWAKAFPLGRRCQRRGKGFHE